MARGADGSPTERQKMSSSERPRFATAMADPAFRPPLAFAQRSSAKEYVSDSDRRPRASKLLGIRERHGARVVVDDLPAVGELLPDEGEHAAGVASGFALQMPLAQNQRGVGYQKPYLQFGKLQLAHGVSVRIVFPVTCDHAVPAARDTVASRKSQFPRMPIACQKGFHIAAVPGSLLRFQYGVDGGAVCLARVRGFREQRPLARHKTNGEQRYPSNGQRRDSSPSHGSSLSPHHGLLLSILAPCK